MNANQNSNYDAEELNFQRKRSELIFEVINDLAQLNASQEDFTDLTFITRAYERLEQLASFCGYAKPLVDYCLSARLSLPDDKTVVIDELLAEEHDLSLNAILEFTEQD